MSNLNKALDHALRVNSQIADLRRAAANPQAAPLDTKRTRAWCEYGWPDNVCTDRLLKLYQRNALAHGLVNKLSSLIWRDNPIIKEDQISAQLDRIKFWKSCMEADKRHMVSAWSGLLLRFRDSRRWDQPVTGGQKTLVEVIPVWRNSLKIAEWDSDLSSENYGKPKKWQYAQPSLNGQPTQQLDVHPDRIFIIGDYSHGSVGLLEPIYNNLVNLEKVEGGSGEALLKNAARHLSANFDPEIDFENIAALYGVKVEDLQKKFNEAARDINQGNDVMLVTQGATVTPLVSNMPDPQPTYDINIQSIACSTGIPSKIIVGMQTGERASSEDQKEFQALGQFMRADRMYWVNDLIIHLMDKGALPVVAGFSVEWSDLTSPTGSAKLADAKLMADINNASLSSGVEVFSLDEIREAAGFEAGVALEPLPEGVDDGESDPSE